MPFRPQHSLLRVEVPALHTIDTSSVENLFGIWSLFRSASNAMEDGRRLENLSWRLWNRETFCCSSDTKKQSNLPRHVCIPTHDAKATADDSSMPELSSSLDSTSSSELDDSKVISLPRARPELRRQHSRGCEKHITAIDLEKIVISMQETKGVEPIDLPHLSMSTPKPTAAQKQQKTQRQPAKAPQSCPEQHRALPHREQASKATASQTPTASSSQATLLQSSASTLEKSDTKSSQTSQTSQTAAGSQYSSSAEFSGHSIVRGFVPGGAPSSYRSQTNLAAAQPTPILKTSPKYQHTLPKKKGPMFTIGTSSGEEESSLDSHMYKSSLSESLRKTSSAKKTSFQEQVAVGKASQLAQDSAVFESDDEDDEVSESAIEDDDDDSSDWEDSDEQSGPSSVNEREAFQRVDSRPNLTSRKSLLTTLMHEPDRAKALAGAASKSTSALRRSRQSTPNGPSVATSPEPNSHLQVPSHEQRQQQSPQKPTQPQPIILTTSNTQARQLALSPRTTRRNMLSTELTESLRKNLLWERQHKSTGNLAALKKRATAQEARIPPQPAEPGPVLSHKEGALKRFSNEYFHQGLGEYHHKGW